MSENEEQWIGLKHKHTRPLQEPYTLTTPYVSDDHK